MNRRCDGLDFFRGAAIVLMVIFHFFYDLAMFGIVKIDTIHDPFWIAFRVIIVSMFLFAVGVSAYLANMPKIRTKKLFKRAFTIGIAAMIISFGSWLFYPKYWVYFGILHFIFVAGFAILPFLPHPKTSLVVAMVILLCSGLGLLHMHGLYALAMQWFDLPRYTLDLVPFFPWFAVVLIGGAFGALGWYQTLFRFFSLRKGAPFKQIIFLGRHALAIYLLHLPLLYGLVYALSYIVVL